MDELTARLEVLFRRYAAAHEPREGVAGVERTVVPFLMDVKLLIAEYGQAAVDAAMDKMPKEPWPSVSLH